MLFIQLEKYYRKVWVSNFFLSNSSLPRDIEVCNVYCITPASCNWFLQC